MCGVLCAVACFRCGYLAPSSAVVEAAELPAHDEQIVPQHPGLAATHSWRRRRSRNPICAKPALTMFSQCDRRPYRCAISASTLSD